MSNKTCTSCNKIFNFPYLLKRHLNGAYGCFNLVNNIQTITNQQIISNQQLIINQQAIIEKYKTSIKPIVSNNTISNTNISDTTNKNNKIKYQCTKCKIIYKHRQSLHKHKKKCNYIEKHKKIPEILVPTVSEVPLEVSEVPSVSEVSEVSKVSEVSEKIEKLEMQIKLQNEELQKLKQLQQPIEAVTKENNDKFKTSFIYLIIEREYIKNKEDIFKVGKTTQKRLKRFDKYTSGSILLSYNRCTDCHISEKEIIKLFKTKYKQRLDIGLEYFEGNHEEMINDIQNIIKFQIK